MKAIKELAIILAMYVDIDTMLKNILVFENCMHIYFDSYHPLHSLTPTRLTLYCPTPCQLQAPPTFVTFRVQFVLPIYSKV